MKKISVSKRGLISTVSIVSVLASAFFVYWWLENKSISADTTSQICQAPVCAAGDTSEECLYQNYTVGCNNNDSTKCLNLGSASEEDNQIYASDTSNYSMAQYDSGIDYRTVEADSTGTNFSLPAVNTNDDHYPRSAMVLEIKYKDTYSDGRSNSSAWANNRIKIDSITDDNVNGSPMTGGSILGVNSIIGLDGKNDGSWKTQHVLINSSDWSRIKAVDGKFNFSLRKNVTSANPVVDLPIDYISIQEVSNDTAIKMTRSLALSQRFCEAENPDSSNTIDRLVWFSRSISEPIYQNTVPDKEETDQKIVKDVSLNEGVTIPISLRSPQSVDDIKITSSSNGQVKLQTVSEVMQEYKRWQHSGWKSFGLMPSYTKEITNSNLQADKTKTFILEFAPSSSPGSQQTTINVSDSSGTLLTIPIEIQTENITLEETEYTSLLWNTFNQNNYSKNNDAVINTVKKFLAQPSPPIIDGNLVKVIKEDGKITDFDVSAYETELARLYSNGLLKGEEYVYMNMTANIVSAAGLSGNYYEKLSDPKFEAAFHLLYDKIESLATKYNIHFKYWVIDEPQNILSRRVIADRLYSYLQEFGAETWVSYYPSSSYDQTITGTDTTESKAYLSIGQVITPLSENTKLKKMCAVNLITDSNLSLCDSYYNSSSTQISSPIYNRFVLGLYANKTSPKAIGIYSFSDSLGDPYNDFDYNWNQVPGTWPEPDYVLTYPADNGDINPGINYYGVREGIIDDQYLETLKKLIAKNNTDPSAIQAQAYIDQVLGRVSSSFSTDYKNNEDQYGFYKSILQDVSETGSSNDFDAFDAVRGKIRDYIKQLSPVAEPSPVPSPIPSPSSTPDTSATSTVTAEPSVTSTITATPSPTPTSSEHSIQISRGFTYFNIPASWGTVEVDSEKSSNTSIIWQYNWFGDKLWQPSQHEETVTILHPGIGYYVSTNLDNQSLVFKAKSDNSDVPIIKPGWNLLSNSSTSALNIATKKVRVLKAGQDASCNTTSCAETKTIGQLVGDGIVYKKIWLIRNATSTDPATAFGDPIDVTVSGSKIPGTNSSDPTHAQGYWIYSWGN